LQFLIPTFHIITQSQVTDKMIMIYSQAAHFDSLPAELVSAC